MCSVSYRNFEFKWATFRNHWLKKNLAILHILNILYSLHRLFFSGGRFQKSFLCEFSFPKQKVFLFFFLNPSNLLPLILRVVVFYPLMQNTAGLNTKQQKHQNSCENEILLFAFCDLSDMVTSSIFFAPFFFFFHFLPLWIIKLYGFRSRGFPLFSLSLFLRL